MEVLVGDPAAGAVGRDLKLPRGTPGGLRPQSPTSGMLLIRLCR